MERVADYVIRRITESGIKHIFMITGRGILYLTDAVAKNKDIDAICTYHEQGASYAAMAYAAASDGMAACLVSTGCAATNAVTAALCAFQDNLPVIFISGQHMLEETTAFTGLQIRTYGSQESNIIPVVKSITKYAAMLMKPEQIAEEMDKAVYYANKGRKGPVWLDVPLDIQNARIETTDMSRYEAEPETINQAGFISDMISVTEEINTARRPVVFIGGGVRTSGAMLLVKRLIETYRMPLVFSTSAADVYGSGNELSIGAVGALGGSRAGNFTVQNADLVLVLGSKLCSQSVGDFKQFAREAKKIVVDIDPYEHTKEGVQIDKLIHSDLKVFLEELLKQELRGSNEDWIEKCLHWKKLFDIGQESFVKTLVQEDKIDLYHFSDVLSGQLTDDATVITDAGFEELIIPSSIKYREGQRCLFPAAQGAMGYALPAVLGAYYAGRRSIVTVVGDGSFMMNMQELSIIREHGIPAKIFVINNNMYAVIRKRQKDLFRARTIGNDPSDGVPAQNFRRLADCFGFAYVKIGTECELEEKMTDVLGKNDPVICEVCCIPDQSYLHTSFGFNEKRKMVRRPLEDLSPFLDREIIKEEMVIKQVER